MMFCKRWLFGRRKLCSAVQIEELNAGMDGQGDAAAAGITLEDDYDRYV